MHLLSKIRHFISRNKNKFILGGILITGSVFLTKYAQQKLKDWQEKEMLEFLDRTRKQQHFENISRTWNQTFLTLANSLIDIVSQVIDTDKIISELRSKQHNKISSWESLKVLLIAKSCCLIYSMSILGIILKIQLNLIGGYLCKNPSSISTESQEKFLSLTQTFLNDGIKELSIKITKVVIGIIGLVKCLKTHVGYVSYVGHEWKQVTRRLLLKMSVCLSSLQKLICKNVVDLIDLKKQMRLCDIDALFWSLETAICDSEDNPLDNLNSYINWRLNDNGTNEDVYHDLIRDSQDLLESDEVKSLTSQCVNRGFILLANQLSEFYMEHSTTGSKDLVYSNQEDFDHFKIKKPLAKLLPIINGLLSKNSFPEKLKQQLVTYDKPQIFAANVFESLL